MTTRQAEDILEHTFKQLEKMLQDESRKKSDRRQPHEQHQEKKSIQNPVQPVVQKSRKSSIPSKACRRNIDQDIPFIPLKRQEMPNSKNPKLLFLPYLRISNNGE